jgi:predicted DCC family thiol-disulfide oxidoreductase YuxK
MKRVRHQVIYDDACAFCARQMRLLRRLDWLGRFQLVPRSSPEAQLPGLSPEVLFQAIHCVTVDGRVFRGARCLRFVGLRLPLLAPLAVLLWVPGVLGLAERVYAWISRNRHRLGGTAGPAPTCGPACASAQSPTNRDAA